MSERQKAMDTSSDRNSIKAWATRHDDSDNFKEYELHITTAPKACPSPDDACASDCTSWIVSTRMLLVNTYRTHRAGDVLQRAVIMLVISAVIPARSMHIVVGLTLFYDIFLIGEHV